MKKLIYIIRKFLGVILFALFIIPTLVLLFNRKMEVSEPATYTIMTIILIGIIVLSLLIYPFRFKYCKCGRKYDSVVYVYKTTSTANRKDENKLTTYYQYHYDVVHHCEQCNKDFITKETLDGGNEIEDLKTHQIIDNKITKEDALKKKKHQ
jgi:hypothetical protein